MVKKADIPDHVIKSALKLAGEEGWVAVTLLRLSEVAKVPLLDIHSVVSSRQSVLDGIGRLIDDAVLAEGGVDPKDTARDRLFEVIMRRFDMLQQHRAGILAIADGLRREPLMALGQGPALERSMRLMLEIAGLPARGLIGLAKVRVLTLVYLDLMRTWRADESEDMAKTMKALDKRLGQVEQLANTFERGRPTGRRRTDDHPDPAPPEVPEEASNEAD